ncbi:MAG: glycosyltransferase family 2 protein [Chitinophagales bacterium]
MLENITKHHNSSKADYRFSILIPTWNNIDYLKLCISSIKRNSSLEIQLIVIINEGNDGTIEWLEEQRDIDYIVSKENIGICYALNIARSLIKSEYIVYMNDDMYVLPNWDTELDQEINTISHKSFMLSSTMIEPFDTGNPCVVVKSYGETVDEFDEQKLLKEYHALTTQDWNGSTWPPNLIHKDLWDLVGGMSIEFSPGMYSDPDLSRKLYESGVRHFKGLGKSLVYHFGSKSTKKLKKSRGRELFLLKWGITSNVFMKKILHVGKPFRILKNSTSIRLDFLIGKVKILFTSNKRG